MSARSGVFVRVVKRYELADPGKGGQVVLLLKCGHARTVVRSASKGKRAWCRLCTAAAKKEASKPTRLYTKAQVERMVQRALAKTKPQPTSEPTA